MLKFCDFEFVTFDPNELAQKFEELGHQWAKARQDLEAAKVAYDRAKSQTVIDLVKTGSSATLAGHTKYASEQVRIAGALLAEAHRIEVEAKTSYESAMAYKEMKRSLLSTERAAMTNR